ncbi:MAG: hypothetical protein LBF88_01205 [Planctomycetaceae bacterium]|nr:hypothetical protein [Planctomycetaceae bacterium]
MPTKIRKRLEEIPLIIEDYPSRRMLRETKSESDEGLCGCFIGVPFGKRSPT